MKHVQNRCRKLLIASAIFLLGLAAFALAASAQTYTVIHNFTGAQDGGSPPYGLAVDRSGNYYGTAALGGQNGNGIVYKLSKSGSHWLLNPVYNFADQDGEPNAGVTIAADGSIYVGAGYNSVMGGPCGSALHLQPSASRPVSILSNWHETLMHTFRKSQDGCNSGNLLLDAQGNVYGTTQIGGADGGGSVYELSRNGDSWTETILWTFTGGNDGATPYDGLVADSAGNLYGTAYNRGQYNWGVVFELTPSGSGWTETTLYSFKGGSDGAYPAAGVIFDSAGNLYGATTERGANGGGTVFELSPSGGSWNINVLTSLTGADGPVASLTMDPSGNLYGTTFMDDSYGYGSVFKLTKSGGSWTYSDLHDFTGGTDGGYPGGSVSVESNGNILGTAVLGGASGNGVIFEVTP